MVKVVEIDNFNRAIPEKLMAENLNKHEAQRLVDELNAHRPFDKWYVICQDDYLLQEGEY